MLAALLPVLSPILGKVTSSLFPDPEKAAEAQAKLMSGLLEHDKEIQSAVADIIKTEAASTHWLAANWRPLTMLTFVGLIVARWCGWTADNMTEAEYIEVYGLIKLGLAGYVIGRSAEKVLPGITKSLTK